MKIERLNSDIIKGLEARHDLNLLVTDQLNKKYPVYRWYNYKHSFSRDLVTELFKAFSLKRGSKKIILDPFCGAGTTLLAAKEYGINGYGIDVMPFSLFITEAKSTSYDSVMLQKRYIKIKKHIELYKEAPRMFKSKRELLKKYFTKEILDWVLYIYSWIIHQPERKTRLFFMTALFSILENISQMKKDGGFLRNYSREIDVITAQKRLIAQIDLMLSDIEKLSFSGITPSIFIDDVRCLNMDGHVIINKCSIDAIITSPPYPNRHDYTRIYGLESILGFSHGERDIKIIRYNTLRSHVEARKSIEEDRYKCSKRLCSITKELEQQKLPNKEVVPMLGGYFEDMFGVFRKLHSVLKPQGFFALVVCDVQYGGIVIPVGDLLDECAQSVGFFRIKKIIARTKNNSSQQMKQFGKHPIGEYIFIWQK